jgi:purine-binding chemotaxis protein CheW
MEKKRLEKIEKKQILVFHLANEELGLEIAYVREALRPQKIFPLPKTPSFIEGVIHVRGHLVALIDLGKRLHVQPIQDESDRKIIVCKVDKFIVGLVVDRLREIIDLSKENFKPTPEVVSIQMNEAFLSGVAIVGERVIPVLNLEHLLTQKEVDALSAIKS